MYETGNASGVYTVLPQCTPYHPASELAKQAGYYPNISAIQLAAASQVMRMIQDEKLNFETDREDTFLKVLRFLRARKYNVKNAMQMIREDVRWRAEQNRLNLSQESAQEVLNCEVKLLYQYFPVWFQGFDKQMRPVSYRQFGKFEIWNVLKLTTMERLVRFHAWETEQALRSMYELTETTGYNIETFVLVIDAAGWNMKLATTDAFTFIKGMAVTDSDHYPERLGTMVIINAPTMLSFAWRIIQGFLDPVTKDKIRILSDPADWQPVLQQYIDRDQIPQQYGGTARDLTADEAISAMNPPKSTSECDGIEEISSQQSRPVARTLSLATPDSPNAAPRLITEGRNRTPFTPRLSHLQPNGTPMSALTESTVFTPAGRSSGGVNSSPVKRATPVSNNTPIAASSGTNGRATCAAAIRRPHVAMADAGTQTDDGCLILEDEIARTQNINAQCSVM
jgi:hypothetical protein